MRRSSLGIGLLFGLLWVVPADAAPPKPKANQPSVDADKLPPGQFAGVLMSVPDSDRMFTLKITYPEIRLKPGAKMPNLRSAQARNMQQMYQQLSRAQRMPRVGHSHNALNNMVQMQNAYMQGQQRMAQAMARAEQQELRLLQQEVQAILNMYQVVQVKQDFDFQTDENFKVRVKDLPEQFDEKGNIKKYTAQEKAELKGKDKNLPGYESSPDALKVGQTVLVMLRAYKKPKPTPAVTNPVASDKDKDADKDKDKDAAPDKDAPKDKDAAKDKSAAKDKEKETDASIQHKMQVKVIVILQEGNAPQNSTTKPKKK